MFGSIKMLEELLEAVDKNDFVILKYLLKTLLVGIVDSPIG